MSKKHELLEKDYYKKHEALEKNYFKLLEEYKKDSKALEIAYYKKHDALNKQIQEVNQMIGGVGNSNGLNAEEFFSKSLEKSLKIGNYVFDDIGMNFSKYSKKNKMKQQYDIVMHNTDIIAVIEVKYKLTQDYVEKFYKKSLPRFKDLFPMYANYKLLGGVASFSDEKNARKLAADYGLFVLGQAGNNIEIINSDVREF
ncbi:MAG: hypothetical protein OMM_02175 [Candidatus Magnetoglobus multicellularis str. Araruama]|uniref:DUF3782 domain-containing protein n=1 Tax=Candidatus Magnetoglobus multicellularis str. Araruama TaxID=890399 RepID=A0A1V1PAY6_9BACT|nr:MAG: hypothetical protein OMM_02175 [Candidatus Magnetoglobus multicellularis str. Araruama]